MAIEKVQPGLVLDQEIKDLSRENIVYKPGIRLTAEIINNILSLEYLKIEVRESVQDQQSDITNNIPTKTYKAGEFIFFQGEPANHIYILQKGIIHVLATEIDPPYDDLDKARQFVQQNGKVIGQIRDKNTRFGEMAAILNGLRSASIKCASEVKVIEISTNEIAFKKTLLYNPKLGLSLATTLAQRLIKLRLSIKQVNAYYDLLAKKISIYQTAYKKIRDSINKKSESQLKEWLNKLNEELKVIPPLSNYQKFKPREIKRTGVPLRLTDQILSPNFESNISINSYLAVSGKPQTHFFILKKGKIESPVEDNKINLYSEPGFLLEALAPIANLGNFTGVYRESLRTITPVRCYRIPLAEFENIARDNPPLILFICKWIANEIIIDDQFLLNLLDAFETDLNSLSIGDTNYRRAYKKINRLLTKFSKDPIITQAETSLAASLQQQVDKDYAMLRDSINQIHFEKAN